MILLIEDDDTTRELTAAVLRCAGHNVRTAPNGRAALAMLAVLDEILPAVIFCDLDMPLLDGWAFRRLQLASDCLRHIPFIIVSAVISPEDEQAGLGAATLCGSRSTPKNCSGAPGDSIRPRSRHPDASSSRCRL